MHAFAIGVALTPRASCATGTSVVDKGLLLTNEKDLTRLDLGWGNATAKKSA